MKKLKQILANKNTVTVIGVILGVLVLYFFYNWRVSQATSPVRVPYALQAIDPRKEITSDMIGYLEISQSAMKGNVLTNANTQILGMYSQTNIPAGSLFYASQVVRKEDLPDSFLIDIEEGYVAYDFDVDIRSTYGNSMYPGNYVDVYFKGEDDAGLIMIGKLIENVKILAVKDSSGRHVFESTTEDRAPSQIIFQVTNEMHMLLRKAEYIRNAEIILVPTNASLEVDGETVKTNVTSETIKEYINSKATTIDEDVKPDTEENQEENNQTE